MPGIYLPGKKGISINSIPSFSEEVSLERKGPPVRMVTWCPFWLSALAKSQECVWIPPLNFQGRDFTMIRIDKDVVMAYADLMQKKVDPSGFLGGKDG